MIILKNRRDDSIGFEKLETAKKYYAPDLDEFPEATEYERDIKMADDLEQLADVLNKYTDLFGDGSEFFTREI